MRQKNSNFNSVFPPHTQKVYTSHKRLAGWVENSADDILKYLFNSVSEKRIDSADDILKYLFNSVSEKKIEKFFLFISLRDILHKISKPIVCEKVFKNNVRSHFA